jgi:hypothetical protein
MRSGTQSPKQPAKGTGNRRQRGWLLLSVIVALGTMNAVSHAMVVAPHALYIDHRTRSGVLYLQNPGDTPEEFSIKLQFGYPVSDSLGGVFVQLLDEPPPGAPSAAEWVRALPARAVVQPGERQAVRLLAMPPPDLPDGEYWSRVIIESRTANPPVAVTDDEQVMVGLTLQMRTITSLTYRKGPVTTGVHVRDFGARFIGDELQVELDLERTGNAAFIGKLRFTLTDRKDKPVAEWSQAIAVYRDLQRRLRHPLTERPAGEYRLHLQLTTDREDIAPQHVLPIEPVERVVNVARR